MSFVNDLSDAELVTLYQSDSSEAALELLSRYAPLRESLLKSLKQSGQSKRLFHEMHDHRSEFNVIFLQSCKKYKAGHMDFRGYINSQVKMHFKAYLRKYYRDGRH